MKSFFEYLNYLPFANFNTSRDDDFASDSRHNRKPGAPGRSKKFMMFGRRVRIVPKGRL